MIRGKITQSGALNIYDNDLWYLFRNQWSVISMWIVVEYC